VIDAADIKARADCREIARARGVRIKREQGDTMTAHCFNPDGHNNGDRKPSLSVFREGFKCFGCGISGDALGLVMELDGVDFKTALAQLAGELGLSDDAPYRPRRRQQPEPTPTTRQIAARGVGPTERIRADLWGRIWGALVFSDQPEAPAAWAAERGISWQAATLASVRDATHAAGEIIGILRGHTRSELIAAGAIREDGTPWGPLAELGKIAAGDIEHASGAFIPIWSPGKPHTPVGFRFRIYNPTGRLKSLAQFSGAPVLPLGLDSIAQARRLGEPYSVLICEGETDWLAAQDAMRTLGRPCAVLAHCMMSAAWSPAWTALLAGAARVVVLFDRGHGEHPNGQARAIEIAGQLAAIRGDPNTPENLRIHLTEEGGEDLADLHKKGDLTPLLRELTLDRHTPINEEMTA